jgi:hypothetical protein
MQKIMMLIKKSNKDFFFLFGNPDFSLFLHK